MPLLILFWSSLALILYIYAGYLALCVLLGAVLNRRVRKSLEFPGVTVVISAFNEAAEIEATVRNKLGQDYPADKLRVLVVSDGSTDRTEPIVEDLAAEFPDRVRLVRQSPRQGKTQALNRTMAEIDSQIVVFSDANSRYAEDTVRMLVESFADPGVGYVTGRMVYTVSDEGGVGRGSTRYMSYENMLRWAETRIGSIVGVDGGVDAVRRELYVPMHASALPDFVLPLQVVRGGKRVVYEPRAALYEEALGDSGKEFQMRVRVGLRAFWTLFEMRVLFNPLRYPLFAWQLASHKLLRYLAFIPLSIAAVANVAVVTRGPLYAAVLTLQCIFYTAAFVGHLFRNSSAVPRFCLAPYYFCLINAACATAFFKFLKGQRITTWIPREGHHGGTVFAKRQ